MTLRKIDKLEKLYKASFKLYCPIIVLLHCPKVESTVVVVLSSLTCQILPIVVVVIVVVVVVVVIVIVVLIGSC